MIINELLINKILLISVNVIWRENIIQGVDRHWKKRFVNNYLNSVPLNRIICRSLSIINFSLLQKSQNGMELFYSVLIRSIYPTGDVTPIIKPIVR